MDIVELVGEEPWVFRIVDFEVAVGWDTGDVSWFENGKEIGYTYNSGWIGLRSVPITLAEGNSQAESAVRISHSMGG